VLRLLKVGSSGVWIQSKDVQNLQMEAVRLPNAGTNEKELTSLWPDPEGKKLQQLNTGFIEHNPHEVKYTS
jgi:hypothetical protein